MANQADDMLAMVLDSADGFLADQHSLERLRIGLDGPQSVVRADVWGQMAELGWLGLGLPETMGGLGFATATSAALCERIGRALLPEPLISGALMPGALLDACPASAVREALAEGLVAGTQALTLAWQENPGRIMFDQMTTTLDGGRLTGAKTFVPCALPNTTLVVLAQSGGNPVLVVVPLDQAGVSARPYRMGDGGRMADIGFDEVPIDGPPLAVGAEAVAAVQRALDLGTVALAAQLTGLAEGALALSLDYLRTRTQFGKPIGAFQALQHRAVDLYLAVELARASWRRAAVLFDQAPGEPVTIAAVSAAKAAAAKAARQTSQAGVQIFGAMGFTEEADIGLYLRAALHLGSWLGGETLHRRRFLAATRGGARA